AGGGSSSSDGIAATSAALQPMALALDTAGNVYVADAFPGSRIRKISTTGVITTVAGSLTSGCSGDGGSATAATMSLAVNGIAVDSANNLYIADKGCSNVRRVSASGVISTLAGNAAGNSGFSGDGGPA